MAMLHELKTIGMKKILRSLSPAVEEPTFREGRQRRSEPSFDLPSGNRKQSPDELLQLCFGLQITEQRHGGGLNV